MIWIVVSVIAVVAVAAAIILLRKPDQPPPVVPPVVPPGPGPGPSPGPGPTPGPAPTPGPTPTPVPSGGGSNGLCTWTEFGPWSGCSASCNGTQFATRSILQTSDWTKCPSLIRTQPCNQDPLCGRVQNCIPGEPTTEGWSGCPSCLGPDVQGPIMEYQFVAPIQNEMNGGTQCTFGDLLRTRTCSTTAICPDPVNCAFSPNSITTPCNVPCGIGQQFTYYFVDQASMNGGEPCDWDSVVVPSSCNAGPCTEDCSNLNWPNDWSECDAVCGEGMQYRTRAPTSADDKCPLIEFQTCQGPPCSGVPSGCVAPSFDQVYTACYETCLGLNVPFQWTNEDGAVTCSLTSAQVTDICGPIASGTCPEPVDCQVSDWSNWSACSLFDCDSRFPNGGVQARSRSITVQPIGGTPCPDLVEYQPCNNMNTVTTNDGTVYGPECVPVACQVGAFTEASGCSVLCGNGIQYFTRSITTLASGGAPPCPVDPSYYISISNCAMPACQNCEYEPWSTYDGPISACSAQGPPVGTQMYGPRSILTPAGPGGAPCNLADAYSLSDCCTKNGECDCPLGCNNLPCSGRGTCDTSTGPGGAPTCVCSDAFTFGAACEIQCPSGYNGLPCNGHGTCNESTNGVCQCDPGFTGEACENGGVCLMHYAAYDSANPAASERYSFWMNSSPTYYSVAIPIGPGSIDIDTCLAMDGMTAPVNKALTFGNIEGYSYNFLNFSGPMLEPYSIRTSVSNSVPFTGPSSCGGSSPGAWNAYNCLLKTDPVGVQGLPTFSGPSDPKFASFMQGLMVNTSGSGPVVKSPTDSPFFFGTLNGYNMPSPNFCDFLNSNVQYTC